MGALSKIVKTAFKAKTKKKKYTNDQLRAAFKNLSDGQIEMMKKRGIDEAKFVAKYKDATAKSGPTLNIPVSVRNKVIKFLATVAGGAELGARTEAKKNKKALGGFQKPKGGNIGNVEAVLGIGKGMAGDAAPQFQKVGKQPRTKIYNTRISDSPDAGFSGSKKIIKPGSFKEAFAVAFAKGPGTKFTFKGKQYKAIKKHAGKGPPKNRKEDKVTKATIIKGKRDTTKSKDPVAAAGAGVGAGAAAVKKKKKLLRPSKFAQRKAGGLSEGVKKVKAMEANKGAFPDLSGDGKVTQKDILIGKGVYKKSNGGLMTKGQGAAVKGTKFKGIF
tara:strand:+ start:7015 stop:8004 length:990 start_codon:yes stop_codon:yes gene_type:complete